MQIYCPKCKTGYEIDANVVPETGRKLRCAVCHKIFKCMPEDLLEGSKLRQAEFTAEERKFLDENEQLNEEAFAEQNKLENREDVEGKKEKVLSKKEIKVKEHLEEMAEITRHLSYNDINLLKKNKTEKLEKDEKIDTKDNIIQKERQD